MAAMAWIKNGPLFQRATFNLDCYSLLVHQHSQTNCCVSTTEEVVNHISGTGTIRQGSEGG